MKNYIQIKDNKLYLDNRVQVSPAGREFRFSKIEKDLKKPPIWIQKTEKWCWIYSFVYLDDNSFFRFYFDYGDKFICKM